jgi:hypothetical protein
MCEWPLDTPAWAAPSMTALGHEDRFQRPSLSGCCRFGYATFAGTRGNGRDAPTPELPALPLNGEARPEAVAAANRRLLAPDSPLPLGQVSISCIASKSAPPPSTKRVEITLRTNEEVESAPLPDFHSSTYDVRFGTLPR